MIDTRRAADFAAAHVPGTINIPLNRSFNTWAGWLVPYDRDFYLIVEDGESHALDEAVKDLAMIGLDRIGGYFTDDVVEAWAASGRALGSVPQLTADDLAARPGEFAVLDVRGRAEWEAARLPDTVAGGRLVHIPLGYLTDRLDEVPVDRPSSSTARAARGAPSPRAC